MKIVHAIESLIVNSGVSVFTAEVANAQAVAGHDVMVCCNRNPDYPTGAATCVVKKDFTDDVGVDVVHVEGIWDYYCLKVMRRCLRKGIPYIVSPHGGLMPRVFAKGWLKKYAFYCLLLKKCLKKASAVHCTGEGEVLAVKRLGLQVPTFIAPLGCHLPKWPVRRIPGDEKTVLFLSRISEEKGLVSLLDAWKLVPHDGWRMIIAGPDWRGYRKMLEAKIAEERLGGVEFVGSADAEMKDRLYRQADMFVLPSPVENFSMVVLDALSYGIPVVCTKGTPWRCIEEEWCGWWVESNSAQALAGALQVGMGLSRTEWLEMSRNARKLAGSFSWENVTKIVTQQYLGAKRVF